MFEEQKLQEKLKGTSILGVGGVYSNLYIESFLNARNSA